MLKKVLIANRGEIALRILRTCKELDIKTVAVHSVADKNLQHVLLADETVCIGPSSSIKSYLNIPAIIAAAEITGSNAIHPGYGFLSENADFAEQVEKSGFIFIGPKSETIRLMGNKISAIQTMKKLGIPCIPGSGAPLQQNIKKNIILGDKIGYPVIIKSASGGGGRGMRIVNDSSELENIINITRAESISSFNDDIIYMEKYLEHPKHIECQIICDNTGKVMYLGERDCSIQRKHQKIVEEAPTINIPNKIMNIIRNLCIKACKKIKYRSAGTFEFLYENKKFYFIEMNTRIQVEHPITEMITGIDLIKEQINIAIGKKFTKNKKIKMYGHSLECRINAEDSYTSFPSAGTITRFHAPSGFGVRWESHIYDGYKVPPYYDPMIGKLITYGKNRKIAIAKMKNALSELIIEGIKTNIDLHINIINDDDFQKGNTDIHYLTNKLEIINK